MKKGTKFLAVFFILTALMLSMLPAQAAELTYEVLSYTKTVKKGEKFRFTIDSYYDFAPETGTGSSFHIYYYIDSDPYHANRAYYGEFKEEKFPVDCEVEVSGLEAGRHEISVYTLWEKAYNTTGKGSVNGVKLVFEVADGTQPSSPILEVKEYTKTVSQDGTFEATLDCQSPLSGEPDPEEYISIYYFLDSEHSRATPFFYRTFRATEFPVTCELKMREMSRSLLPDGNTITMYARLGKQGEGRTMSEDVTMKYQVLDETQAQIGSSGDKNPDTGRNAPAFAALPVLCAAGTAAVLGRKRKKQANR